ncbi:TPA: hypothetical protein ACQUJI_001833, partial [Neisseria cinerea]
KTIPAIHSDKPIRQNRNNRKYTETLEKKINELIKKDLIDKWAFPCNLFNLSSLQKTGHEKTLLTRSLAAVFADTMANVLDFIAKGEYKVFTGKALLAI